MEHSPFRRGAEDRDRTGTGIATHGILSPGRLPVPPLRQNYESYYSIPPLKCQWQNTVCQNF